MSEIIVGLTEKGAQAAVGLASKLYSQAVEKTGSGTGIGFPQTASFLPFIYAVLGRKVETLGDLGHVFSDVSGLLENKPCANGLQFNDFLGGLLNKGVATLLAAEVIAALKYSAGEHPGDDFSGFIPDTVLRSLGLQLVDGRISGVAVVLGASGDAVTAEKIIRKLQEKNIVALLAGNVSGKSVYRQLLERKVGMGLDHYIVPMGDDYISAVYAVNFAIRASLTFGGCKPGQWQEIFKYCQLRVPAFVLNLGFIDEIITATAVGAISLGFPVITDLDVPEVGKIPTTMYEALLKVKDYDKIVERCVEARGIKVKVASIDVPVSYSAAFEGERVRKEDLCCEFGGKHSQAVEWLTTSSSSEVEDGRVEVDRDIDSLIGEEKKSFPLAIVVQVCGRKMQKDFEPILERQIHRFINYCMGVMHVGQRDMDWIRVSKDAFDKGFRLKHIGKVLHGMLHSEYSSIVDKVQVKIYTDAQAVSGVLAKARKVYEERDERLRGMTDESVDVFYSCLLCQSFAPNHVCIVTPERLGLCGAYSWLDAKASCEITPSGPNQPIEKGSMLDEKSGKWQGINDFIFEKSNKTVSDVSMYSMLDSPQTSCGCFECIIALIPELNAIMAVNRDFAGMTPVGMSFTTLAGSVGGGVQTPGFLGVGKLYLASRKFVTAEGGLKRLVWMPKSLKEALYDKLSERARQEGVADLLDKIADETVATTVEELGDFLQKVKHPVLTMPPLL